MYLKVIVRLGTTGESSPEDDSAKALQVSADRCAVELPARDSGGGTERLQFDRVYAASVPTLDVFADGVWTLVKLALAGNHSSAIVLTGASQVVDRPSPMSPASSADDGGTEGELGLALALALLIAEALLKVQAAGSVDTTADKGEGPRIPKVSALRFSWSCFDSPICDNNDLLGSLPPSVADVEKADTDSSAATSIVLRSMDEIWALMRWAVRLGLGHRYHSLLSFTMSCHPQQARGSVRIFSLAAGRAGTSAVYHAAAAASGTSNTRKVGDVEDGVGELLAGCFRPPHRTLLTICVPHQDSCDEVPALLRFAACLRFAVVSPRAEQHKGQQDLPTPKSPALRSRRVVSLGRARTESRGYSRSSSRHRSNQVPHQDPRQAELRAVLQPTPASAAPCRRVLVTPRGAAVQRSRPERGLSRESAPSMRSPSEETLLLRRLVRLQELEVENLRGKARALEEACAELHGRAEEATAAGRAEAEAALASTELSEEVRQALRAKDRMILELQTRASERRSREEQLVSELEAARREQLLEGAAWPHHDCSARHAEALQGACGSGDENRDPNNEVVLQELVLKCGVPCGRRSVNCTRTLERQEASNDVAAKLEPCREVLPPSGSRQTRSPETVQLHGDELGLSCSMPMEGSDQPIDGASLLESREDRCPQVWPWELAELFGFLEARFGSVESFLTHIGGGQPYAVTGEVFVGQLTAIGYSEDVSLLHRLWASCRADAHSRGISVP